MLAKTLLALACPPWRGMGWQWTDASANAPLFPARYHLVAWPHLEERWHTARALRALSVMSVRPVTLHWVALQTGWSPACALEFMRALEQAACVQCVEAPPRLAVTP